MTTIIIPISRPDYLHKVFSQLEMMPCDQENINLFTYVDGDLDLFEKARNFTVQSKFREKLCVYRQARHLPDVGNVKKRRQRIADIHNEIKNHISDSSEFVFLIEDDTLAPLNTYQKLTQAFSTYPYAGFITGVQIGRWGIDSPGIWQVDNVYSVQQISSVLPPPRPDGLEGSIGIQQITAAGMYCMLMKTALYKKHSFSTFESLLGPDVNLGIQLTKEGYKNYVDWSIETQHLTKKGPITVRGSQLEQITHKRTNKGTWLLEITSNNDLIVV